MAARSASVPMLYPMILDGAPSLVNAPTLDACAGRTRTIGHTALTSGNALDHASELLFHRSLECVLSRSSAPCSVPVLYPLILTWIGGP